MPREPRGAVTWSGLVNPDANGARRSAVARCGVAEAHATTVRARASTTAGTTGRRICCDGSEHRPAYVLCALYPAPAVKIFVIGAGQVGTTIVEALHGEHDVTVLDLDPARLAAISQRFDVATLEANGASRRALADAGVRDADL